MKNIFKTLTLFLAIVLLSGCHKITTDGVTFITYYPQFDMKGEPFMFILMGSSYVEPGVIATEGDAELSLDTKGSVNTSVRGVYTLQYSATNKDGFQGTVERMVAVVSALPAVDLSGNYSLVSTTREKDITITKNGDVVGYYHSTDSWYQVYPIALDFVDMGDGTIYVIPGSSRYGPHIGTGVIMENNQVQFNCRVTSGINEGVSWATIFQKQ